MRFIFVLSLIYLDVSISLSLLNFLISVVLEIYMEAAFDDDSWGLCLSCIFFLFFSDEEAKKKIYNVSCEKYFGFGCEIDEETSNKLEGLY